MFLGLLFDMFSCVLYDQTLADVGSTGAGIKCLYMDALRRYNIKPQIKDLSLHEILHVINEIVFVNYH